MSGRAPPGFARPDDEACVRGFEPRDLPAKAIGLGALGFFASIGVAGLLLFGLLTVLTRETQGPPATAVEVQRIIPPEPRLETAPAADRQALEEAALAKLDGYRWIDRAAGIAQIPIGRAMELLAGRGWPDKGSAR